MNKAEIPIRHVYDSCDMSKLIFDITYFLNCQSPPDNPNLIFFNKDKTLYLFVDQNPDGLFTVILAREGNLHSFGKIIANSQNAEEIAVYPSDSRVEINGDFTQKYQGIFLTQVDIHQDGRNIVGSYYDKDQKIKVSLRSFFSF